MVISGFGCEGNAQDMQLDAHVALWDLSSDVGGGVIAHLIVVG